MLKAEAILFFSFGYMGLLFAIAFFGDKHAKIGRSIVSNPYIYTLSLAVFCTAWTFYGSVGRAAATGIGFLPTYIGPTLMAALGWFVLRKLIRISKIHRITSIADFIASRYGKSSFLASVVTIIAVLGVIPYISLQLKAISTSFLIIKEYPIITMPGHFAEIPVHKDTAFYVALLLAIFTILFGTRHLDATERHEGLVAAIAFESIVKLIAFLAVGIFVTYGIYSGFGDIIERATKTPELKQAFTIGTWSGSYINWSIYIFLSMMAVLFLPRQFQIAVVENVDEEHLKKAIWLFPLYLFAINIFVLPIAFGGMLHFVEGNVDADFFVLTLPMSEHKEAIALLVFIGGMSAATGMVIVATIALSTMICNDLLMPVLLRLQFFNLATKGDLSHFLLTIRRGSILLVLLLGYAYFRLIGEYYTLVSIGLISFTAAAQFAPAILGGIFWKGGTRSGALSGLILGFLVWAYTLVFPSLVLAGFLPKRFITEGPFGFLLLRPFQLFGLQGFDHITHAVFWSMLINTTAYVGVSLFSRASAIEHTQAALFVDVFKYSEKPEKSSFWRGTASVKDLKALLRRFLGKNKSDKELSFYAKKHNIIWKNKSTADADMVSYAENLLAGAIGSASARIMVSSVVKEEPLGIDEVMNILDETRVVIAYSRELERATADLQAANKRLKELDRLKDEFISTVTHEFRTPLTSVRSIAEILHENPNIDDEQKKNFSAIIIKEADRLTRLIVQVLDFQKIESGKIYWEISPVDFKEVIKDAISATGSLIEEKKIKVDLNLPDTINLIDGDRDRLIQVMVNLISNAVKFCPDTWGIIAIDLIVKPDHLKINVKDNGIGISRQNQKIVFQEFRQVKDSSMGRPPGSGLGLSITKRIIDFHKGKIWVKSKSGKGSTFSFTLPF
ncbi:MAG: sensor histidine kinase [Thermodesulfobacteriota bacterium]|nr:sensor histidine kinase [Thermodesulfobacteriota bacterium]